MSALRVLQVPESVAQVRDLLTAMLDQQPSQLEPEDLQVKAFTRYFVRPILLLNGTPGVQRDERESNER